jgi:predicted transcriptional regulator
LIKVDQFIKGGKMAEKNETTLRVLELLARKSMTTDELAKALECSRSNVTTILLKLRKFNRVSRELVDLENPVTIQYTNPPVERPRVAYSYAITSLGRERMKFLKNV